ncbi:MAG: phosphatase PAP2 family protein [Actinobacteria bacterium]|nr:phosphatase PAP2 family protein [Actinomycetota bacterium]
MKDWDPRRVYAVVLALSTVTFAAFAAAVLFWADAVRLDVRAVNWVQRTVPDTLVDVMQVVTYAGSAVFLGPLVILAGVLLVWRGRPGAALFVIAAFAGSQISSQALKALFQRGRPELEDPFVQLTTYAFPSGHSFGATATYGALALVLASAAVERRYRVGLLVSATALILVIGASRIILGRHYTLDVLAGIAGGVALISALLVVFERTRGGSLRLDLAAGGHEQAQRSGLDS